jgi:hypothetical protein
VCELLKSLYGLNKAPKQWHEELARVFVVNEADLCVHYRHGGGEGLHLFMYVDVTYIWANLNVIKEVKDFLSHCFEFEINI